MRCETNDLHTSDDEGMHDQKFGRVWKHPKELDYFEDEYGEDQPLKGEWIQRNWELNLNPKVHFWPLKHKEKM